MKPRFALDLTNDAISLLERSGEAWLRIDRADLGDPKLDTRLAAMKSLAEERAPEGFISKLILPNSQILYLDLEAPGPDRASRRLQIGAALEGRTPYAVDELVYDWSRNGNWVKVAVLAKVTLEEAESFADAYGFRPVAFVAVPENGHFGGEPFFGTTDCAMAHLPEGERLDRDQDPVRIIDGPMADAPALGPVAAALPDPVATAPMAAPEPDAAAPDAPAEALAPDAPDAPADLVLAEDAGESSRLSALLTRLDDAAFVTVADAPDTAGALPPEEAATPSAQVTAFFADGPAADAQAPAGRESGKATPAPAPGFQSRRAPGPISGVGDRIADVAPRLGGLGTPQAGKIPRLAAIGVAAGPPAAKAAADPRGRPGRNAPTAAARTQAARVALAKAGAAGLALGQSALAMGRAQARNLAKARKPIVADVRKAPPGRAVFGALPMPPSVAWGRPLAVPLMSAMVLAIIAVAIWSLWPGADSAETATDAPTAVIAAAPADAPPAAAPAPTAPAAPETAISAAPAAPEPPPAGLVTAAPPVAPGAEADAVSALAAARADSLPVAPPGAPLPATDTLASDDALPPQPLPQPFGTLLRYDASGLIAATPEGVVTPGGFTLFAARPPRIPPARPAGLAVAAPAPAGAAPATEAAPNPLAGKTPRPRPAGLVPTPPVAPDDAALTPDIAAATQTAALGPLLPPVDPRHAARKPLWRPAAIVAAAEAARANAEAVADAAASAARAEAEAAAAALAGASKQAVASSRRPSARPADFASTVAAATPPAVAAEAVAEQTPIEAAAVEAALAEAQAQPEAEPAPAEAEPEQTAAQDVDEPELQDGVPNMATTKTVAKKSTFANAIDLGDINLIGVYGSSANRRALVRMPNGRFIKVQVGDRLDGGKVAAIGDSQLSYVKKGKTIVLKILKKG